MCFDAYKVLYFQPTTYTILMWSFLQVEVQLEFTVRGFAGINKGQLLAVKYGQFPFYKPYSL